MMFAYLKGYVAYSGKDFVVIDVNGVGYKVYTANPYEFKKEEAVQVFTHQVVSENDMSLYGFKTMEEHDLFINLISARGIGPKTACAILAMKMGMQNIYANSQKSDRRPLNKLF